MTCLNFIQTVSTIIHRLSKIRVILSCFLFSISLAIHNTLVFSTSQGHVSTQKTDGVGITIKSGPSRRHQVLFKTGKEATEISFRTTPESDGKLDQKFSNKCEEFYSQGTVVKITALNSNSIVKDENSPPQDCLEQLEGISTMKINNIGITTKSRASERHQVLLKTGKRTTEMSFRTALDEKLNQSFNSRCEELHLERTVVKITCMDNNSFVKNKNSTSQERPNQVKGKTEATESLQRISKSYVKKSLDRKLDNSSYEPGHFIQCIAILIKTGYRSDDEDSKIENIASNRMNVDSQSNDETKYITTIKRAKYRTVYVHSVFIDIDGTKTTNLKSEYKGNRHCLLMLEQDQDHEKVTSTSREKRAEIKKPYGKIQGHKTREIVSEINQSVKETVETRKKLAEGLHGKLIDQDTNNRTNTAENKVKHSTENGECFSKVNEIIRTTEGKKQMRHKLEEVKDKRSTKDIIVIKENAETNEKICENEDERNLIKMKEEKRVNEEDNVKNRQQILSEIKFLINVKDDSDEEGKMRNIEKIHGVEEYYDEDKLKEPIEPIEGAQTIQKATDEEKGEGNIKKDRNKESNNVDKVWRRESGEPEHVIKFTETVEVMEKSKLMQEDIKESIDKANIHLNKDAQVKDENKCRDKDDYYLAITTEVSEPIQREREREMHEEADVKKDEENMKDGNNEKRSEGPHQKLCSNESKCTKDIGEAVETIYTVNLINQKIHDVKETRKMDGHSDNKTKNNSSEAKWKDNEDNNEATETEETKSKDRAKEEQKETDGLEIKEYALESSNKKVKIEYHERKCNYERKVHVTTTAVVVQALENDTWIQEEIDAVKNNKEARINSTNDLKNIPIKTGQVQNEDNCHLELETLHLSENITENTFDKKQHFNGTDNDSQTKVDSTLEAYTDKQNMLLLAECLFVDMQDDFSDGENESVNISDNTSSTEDQDLIDVSFADSSVGLYICDIACAYEDSNKGASYTPCEIEWSSTSEHIQLDWGKDVYLENSKDVLPEDQPTAPYGQHIPELDNKNKITLNDMQVADVNQCTVSEDDKMYQQENKLQNIPSTDQWVNGMSVDMMCENMSYAGYDSAVSTNVVDFLPDQGIISQQAIGQFQGKHPCSSQLRSIREEDECLLNSKTTAQSYQDEEYTFYTSNESDKVKPLHSSEMVVFENHIEQQYVNDEIECWSFSWKMSLLFHNESQGQYRYENKWEVIETFHFTETLDSEQGRLIPTNKKPEISAINENLFEKGFTGDSFHTKENEEKETRISHLREPLSFQNNGSIVNEDKPEMITVSEDLIDQYFVDDKNIHCLDLNKTSLLFHVKQWSTGTDRTDTSEAFAADRAVPSQQHARGQPSCDKSDYINGKVLDADKPASIEGCNSQMDYTSTQQIHLTNVQITTGGKSSNVNDISVQHSFEDERSFVSLHDSGQDILQFQAMNDAKQNESCKVIRRFSDWRNIPSELGRNLTEPRYDSISLGLEEIEWNSMTDNFFDENLLLPEVTTNNSNILGQSIIPSLDQSICGDDKGIMSETKISLSSKENKYEKLIDKISEDEDICLRNAISSQKGEDMPQKDATRNGVKKIFDHDYSNANLQIDKEVAQTEQIAFKSQERRSINVGREISSQKLKEKRVQSIEKDRGCAAEVPNATSYSEQETQSSTKHGREDDITCQQTYSVSEINHSEIGMGQSSVSEHISNRNENISRAKCLIQDCKALLQYPTTNQSAVVAEMRNQVSQRRKRWRHKMIAMDINSKEKEEKDLQKATRLRKKFAKHRRIDNDVDKSGDVEKSPEEHYVTAYSPSNQHLTLSQDVGHKHYSDNKEIKRLQVETQVKTQNQASSDRYEASETEVNKEFQPNSVSEYAGDKTKHELCDDPKKLTHSSETPEAKEEQNIKPDKTTLYICDTTDSEIYDEFEQHIDQQQTAESQEERQSDSLESEIYDERKDDSDQKETAEAEETKDSAQVCISDGRGTDICCERKENVDRTETAAAEEEQQIQLVYNNDLTEGKTSDACKEHHEPYEIAATEEEKQIQLVSLHVCVSDMTEGKASDECKEHLHQEETEAKQIQLVSTHDCGNDIKEGKTSDECKEHLDLEETAAALKEKQNQLVSVDGGIRDITKDKNSDECKEHLNLEGTAAAGEEKQIQLLSAHVGVKDMIEGKPSCGCNEHFDLENIAEAKERKKIQLVNAQVCDKVTTEGKTSDDCQENLDEEQTAEAEEQNQNQLSSGYICIYDMKEGKKNSDECKEHLDQEQIAETEKKKQIQLVSAPVCGNETTEHKTCDDCDEHLEEAKTAGAEEQNQIQLGSAHACVNDMTETETSDEPKGHLDQEEPAAGEEEKEIKLDCADAGVTDKTEGKTSDEHKEHFDQEETAETEKKKQNHFVSVRVCVNDMVEGKTSDECKENLDQEESKETEEKKQIQLCSADACVNDTAEGKTTDDFQEHINKEQTAKAEEQNQIQLGSAYVFVSDMTNSETSEEGEEYVDQQEIAEAKEENQIPLVTTYVCSNDTTESQPSDECKEHHEETAATEEEKQIQLGSAHLCVNDTTGGKTNDECNEHDDQEKTAETEKEKRIQLVSVRVCVKDMTEGKTSDEYKESLDQEETEEVEKEKQIQLGGAYVCVNDVKEGKTSYECKEHLDKEETSVREEEEQIQLVFTDVDVKDMTKGKNSDECKEHRDQEQTPEAEKENQVQVVSVHVSFCVKDLTEGKNNNECKEHLDQDETAAAEPEKQIQLVSAQVGIGDRIESETCDVDFDLKETSKADEEWQIQLVNMQVCVNDMRDAKTSDECKEHFDQKKTSEAQKEKQIQLNIAQGYLNNRMEFNICHDVDSAQVGISDRIEREICDVNFDLKEILKAEEESQIYLDGVSMYISNTIKSVDIDEPRQSTGLSESVKAEDPHIQFDGVTVHISDMMESEILQKRIQHSDQNETGKRKEESKTQHDSSQLCISDRTASEMCSEHKEHRDQNETAEAERKKQIQPDSTHLCNSDKTGSQISEEGEEHIILTETAKEKEEEHIQFDGITVYINDMTEIEIPDELKEQSDQKQNAKDRKGSQIQQDSSQTTISERIENETCNECKEHFDQTRIWEAKQEEQIQVDGVSVYINDRNESKSSDERFNDKVENENYNKDREHIYLMQTTQAKEEQKTQLDNVTVPISEMKESEKYDEVKNHVYQKPTMQAEQDRQLQIDSTQVFVSDRTKDDICDETSEAKKGKQIQLDGISVYISDRMESEICEEAEEHIDSKETAEAEDKQQIQYDGVKMYISEMTERGIRDELNQLDSTQVNIGVRIGNQICAELNVHLKQKETVEAEDEKQIKLGSVSMYVQNMIKNEICDEQKELVDMKETAQGIQGGKISVDRATICTSDRRESEIRYEHNELFYQKETAEAEEGKQNQLDNVAVYISNMTKNKICDEPKEHIDLMETAETEKEQQIQLDSLTVYISCTTEAEICDKHGEHKDEKRTTEGKEGSQIQLHSSHVCTKSGTESNISKRHKKRVDQKKIAAAEDEQHIKLDSVTMYISGTTETEICDKHGKHKDEKQATEGKQGSQIQLHSSQVCIKSRTESNISKEHAECVDQNKIAAAEEDQHIKLDSVTMYVSGTTETETCDNLEENEHQTQTAEGKEGSQTETGSGICEEYKEYLDQRETGEAKEEMQTQLDIAQVYINEKRYLDQKENEECEEENQIRVGNVQVCVSERTKSESSKQRKEYIDQNETAEAEGEKPIQLNSMPINIEDKRESEISEEQKALIDKKETVKGNKERFIQLESAQVCNSDEAENDICDESKECLHEKETAKAEEGKQIQFDSGTIYISDMTKSENCDEQKKPLHMKEAAGAVEEQQILFDRVTLYISDMTESETLDDIKQHSEKKQLTESKEERQLQLDSFHVSVNDRTVSGICEEHKERDDQKERAEAEEEKQIQLDSMSVYFKDKTENEICDEQKDAFDQKETAVGNEGKQAQIESAQACNIDRPENDICVKGKKYLQEKETAKAEKEKQIQFDSCTVYISDMTKTEIYDEHKEQIDLKETGDVGEWQFRVENALVYNSNTTESEIYDESKERIDQKVTVEMDEETVEMDEETVEMEEEMQIQLDSVPLYIGDVTPSEICGYFKECIHQKETVEAEVGKQIHVGRAEVYASHGNKTEICDESKAHIDQSETTEAEEEKQIQLDSVPVYICHKTGSENDEERLELTDQKGTAEAKAEKQMYVNSVLMYITDSTASEVSNELKEHIDEQVTVDAEEEKPIQLSVSIDQNESKGSELNKTDENVIDSHEQKCDHGENRETEVERQRIRDVSHEFNDNTDNQMTKTDGESSYMNEAVPDNKKPTEAEVAKQEQPYAVLASFSDSAKSHRYLQGARENEAENQGKVEAILTTINDCIESELVKLDNQVADSYRECVNHKDAEELKLDNLEKENDLSIPTKDSREGEMSETDGFHDFIEKPADHKEIEEVDVGQPEQFDAVSICISYSTESETIKTENQISDNLREQIAYRKMREVEVLKQKADDDAASVHISDSIEGEITTATNEIHNVPEEGFDHTETKQAKMQKEKHANSGSFYLTDSIEREKIKIDIQVKDDHKKHIDNSRPRGAGVGEHDKCSDVLFHMNASADYKITKTEVDTGNDHEDISQYTKTTETENIEDGIAKEAYEVQLDFEKHIQYKEAAEAETEAEKQNQLDLVSAFVSDNKNKVITQHAEVHYDIEIHNTDYRQAIGTEVEKQKQVVNKSHDDHEDCTDYEEILGSFAYMQKPTNVLPIGNNNSTKGKITKNVENTSNGRNDYEEEKGPVLNKPRQTDSNPIGSHDPTDGKMMEKQTDCYPSTQTARIDSDKQRQTAVISGDKNDILELRTTQTGIVKRTGQELERVEMNEQNETSPVALGGGVSFEGEVTKVENQVCDDNQIGRKITEILEVEVNQQTKASVHRNDSTNTAMSKIENEAYGFVGDHKSISQQDMTDEHTVILNLLSDSSKVTEIIQFTNVAMSKIEHEVYEFLANRGNTNEHNTTDEHSVVLNLLSNITKVTEIIQVTTDAMKQSQRKLTSSFAIRPNLQTVEDQEKNQAIERYEKLQIKNEDIGGGAAGSKCEDISNEEDLFMNQSNIMENTEGEPKTLRGRHGDGDGYELFTDENENTENNELQFMTTNDYSMMLQKGNSNDVETHGIARCDGRFCDQTEIFEEIIQQIERTIIVEEVIEDPIKVKDALLSNQRGYDKENDTNKEENAQCKTDITGNRSQSIKAPSEGLAHERRLLTASQIGDALAHYHEIAKEIHCSLSKVCNNVERKSSYEEVATVKGVTAGQGGHEQLNGNTRNTYEEERPSDVVMGITNTSNQEEEKEPNYKKKVKEEMMIALANAVGNYESIAREINEVLATQKRITNEVKTMKYIASTSNCNGSTKAQTGEEYCCQFNRDDMVDTAATENNALQIATVRSEIIAKGDLSNLIDAYESIGEEIRKLIQLRQSSRRMSRESQYVAKKIMTLKVLLPESEIYFEPQDEEDEIFVEGVLKTIQYRRESHFD